MAKYRNRFFKTYTRIKITIMALLHPKLQLVKKYLQLFVA